VNTPLSPAAQAVLDAYSNRAKRDLHGRWVEPAIAAALRAAADQAVGDYCRNESEKRIYDRLHRWAAELEGAQ
jgi:hypothetical protein